MNRKIVKYFLVAFAKHTLWVIAISTTGSITAFAQQHDLHKGHDDVRSPYVEQLDSPVRGLSLSEVDNLLNGRGAGYARMAELNGYPGLSHVLDSSSELNLSTQQTEEIEVAFTQMQSQAKSLGQTIVNKEQKLSEAFASGKISNNKFERATNELAQLYGELRKTHLQAHLKINPLLSAEQIQKYKNRTGV